MYLESQHPRGYGGKWADGTSSGGSKGGFWARRRAAKQRNPQSHPPLAASDKMHKFPCVDSNGKHEPGCPHDEEDYD